MTSSTDSGSLKEYRTCIVDGVFDLFHVGHLNILKNAKQLFSVSLVGLNTDDFVEQYKGAKPVIPFNQRKEILESIIHVDGVLPINGYDCYTPAFLDQNSIDYLVHGRTNDPILCQMYAELKDNKMYFEIDETPSIHTTQLVEICKYR
ncbi:MAG: hypothetical protein DHS20C01_26340 [marine bacterium B5-7]|nr:MAG: hypothetical protein DHS20C01_26340 [marine bacterium B5-7]